MAKNEARLGMDISDYEKKLKQATDDLNKFAKGGVGNIGNLVNAFGTLSGKWTGSAGGLIGSLGGLAATFGATASAAGIMSDSISKAMNFEQSMSSLRALTGLGDAEMSKLKDAAVELGATTTQSASQVAEAFKMIGSAKPELLKSADALADVTKDAITLAEAAGIDVAQAAAALTTSLNQMGKGADAATRFINVLAAGSQKGAGNIEWLNSAITQSGTAAKAVGAEYEELVANLEQLAQGGFDASSAGTALRSIIMSLEKQGNAKLKPSVVGLTEAFKNLGQECKSVSDYQDIAGKQFASQAQILAENAAKAEEMRKAITGTSTATEQARINSDNFAGSVKNLESAWEGLMLSINSSNGMLRGWVDNTTKLVNNMRYLLSSRDQQVSMGANAILNGHNGQQGLKDYLGGRMEATAKEGWSQDIVIDRAMKDLKKWFYVKRAENHKDKKMVDTITEAYLRAEEYVRSYFTQTEQAKAATDALGDSLNNMGGDDGDNKPKKQPKVYGVGTIGYYEQRLKEANEALNDAASTEAYESAMAIVDIYKREIARIKGEGTVTTSPATVNKDIAGITGLSMAASSMDLSGVSAAAENNEEIERQMKLLKELDAFNRGAMLEGVQALSGAFNVLGDSIGGTAGNVLTLVGTMAQQIAQGVATIASLQAESAAYKKETGDALALATAKTLAAHAAIPFVGVAMGIGMVASLVATIRSLPKFAEGAFVDKPTIGLFGEAGPELVLPEKKLDEAFARNRFMSKPLAGEVKFRIQGTDLVGILVAEKNRSKFGVNDFPL